MKHPRLLYVGDVPIADTISGQVLLYRLLQNYPPDRLRIVEANAVIRASKPCNRLPHVQYDALAFGNHRLLHSRLAKPYFLWLHNTARLKWRWLRSLFQAFRPDVLLTIGEGFSWLAAAELAGRFSIPLHLIVHDDWPSLAYIHDGYRSTLRKDFKAVYLQAAERYCISPAMVDAYRDAFGAIGQPLYPCRAHNAPEFSSPPPRSSTKHRPFTVVYAGALNISEYVKSLIALADVLESIGGRLVIRSALDARSIEQAGFSRKNIKIDTQFIAPAKFVEYLRENGDLLYVPQSFAESDRTFTSLSFPSKLAEYAGTGLPLLIWGPAYSSAVRWATDNHGAAALVTENDVSELRATVSKLAADRSICERLGYRALQAGKASFSHSVVAARFLTLLSPQARVQKAEVSS